LQQGEETDPPLPIVLSTGSTDRLKPLWIESESTTCQRSARGNPGSHSLKTLNPVSHSLGRLFAASFGCIALSTTILLGLLSENMPESILAHSLATTVVFAIVGLGIGQVADSVVRQSVEMNYRNKFEKLRERLNDAV